VSLPVDGGVYELSASGDQLLLRDESGTELFRKDLSDPLPLVIHGSNGDDVLTLTFAEGAPLGLAGLMFDGGLGVDRLILANGSSTDISHAVTDSASGHASLDGRLVRYSGAEAIDDRLAAARRDFQFGDSSDLVTLADNDSSNDGLSRLTLDGGLSIEFATPSESLSLSAGAGDDTVTLAGADDSLTLVVQVFGQDGNDVLVGRMTADSLEGGNADRWQWSGHSVWRQRFGFARRRQRQ
jgi:hypothetical protein